jgi:hypothetical protein
MGDPQVSKNRTDDVHSITVECGVLETDREDVAINVRSETTAREVVALVLLHCHSTMPADALCLSVAGARDRRFVDAGENVHYLAQRKFRLHLVSERSGASREAMNALRAEVEQHRTAHRETRERLSEAEGALESLAGVQNEVTRLQEEMARSQGEAAARISGLEHELDSARAALDESAARHADLMAARDSETETLEASVAELRAEVRNCRFVNCRGIYTRCYCLNYRVLFRQFYRCCCLRAQKLRRARTRTHARVSSHAHTRTHSHGPPSPLPVGESPAAH